MEENQGIYEVLLLLTKAVKPRENMVNHDELSLQCRHCYTVDSVYALWRTCVYASV